VTNRWIELEGLVNMRDLGGLPTRDGGRTASGRLIRSDNLQDLSDSDVERLVGTLGVTDIVDLRTDTERHVEGPGPLWTVETLTHHHHSLIEEWKGQQRDDVARQALVTRSGEGRAPRDGAFWAEHYLGYLARRPDSVSAALDVVSRSAGATVVHCAAGKDRTGTVVALALDVAGVPREEIIADYVLTAERIEAIMGRLRTRESYSEALAGRPTEEQLPRAESIEAILRSVDEGYGGAAGWLREQGWSTGDVDRLRARLLP
jgi:protein-tyrosine phosphatase